MKFRKQTLLSIAAVVVLLFVYVNIERFTTTITIPDAPRGPAGPAGPPGPAGPAGGATKSTPATVAGGKSVKGANFAKLKPTSDMPERMNAMRADAQAADKAAGLAAMQTCSAHGAYTSECKSTGFCNFGGMCDVTPEDALAYGLFAQIEYDEFKSHIAK